MVIQSIAREAYGLLLSLFEIHTMVHVACAVLLCCFWFQESRIATLVNVKVSDNQCPQKPLGVRTPEHLDFSHSKDIQALMLYEILVHSSQYLTVISPVQSGQFPLLHSINTDRTISLKSDAAGNPILCPTVDLERKVLQDNEFMLQPGEVLPCGVRFPGR
jgi:hypothetical protein